LVERHRLVTVCAPGGMGKTRLTTEFALQSASRWRDGAWMVDLAQVGRVDPIGGEVAATLGVALSEDDPLEGVVERLGGCDALVILDNCEHVLEGARELAGRVLAECPEVRIVATSRGGWECG
jgi:predicted ATPase